MQNTTNLSAAIFERSSWRYYNIIKKKAMGQEFSGKPGGLILSLSIAFFIVLISAQLLNFAYQSMSVAPDGKNIGEQEYYLEGASRENGRILEYRGLV